jgi:hypothetical protein
MTSWPPELRAMFSPAALVVAEAYETLCQFFEVGLFEADRIPDADARDLALDLLETLDAAGGRNTLRTYDIRLTALWN